MGGGISSSSILGTMQTMEARLSLHSLLVFFAVLAQKVSRGETQSWGSELFTQILEWGLSQTGPIVSMQVNDHLRKVSCLFT